MEIYLLALSSLIVVIGPWKAAIVFAERTSGLPLATRRMVAVATFAMSLVIALIFVLLGAPIIDFFHIGEAAFLIAAGLLVLVFAIRMVISEEQHEPQVEGDAQVDDRTPWRLAAYPLSVPMLVTPPAFAALVALSVFVDAEGNALLPVVAAVVTVLMFDLVVFLGEAQWERLVPMEVWSVAGRVLGVLLAGFAMAIILEGLQLAEIVPKPH